MMALSSIETNTILAYVVGASYVVIYTIGLKFVIFGIIPAFGFEIGTLNVAAAAFGVKNWKNLEIGFNQAKN